MSDNRGIVYHDEDQNKIVYRASGLGTCTRALVAARKGYAPEESDSVSDDYMGEGVLHEDHVLARLERGDWEIAHRAQEEVELVIREGNSVMPTIVIRGHIDEVARLKTALFPDVFYVVEVKTMSETRFRTFVAHGIEAFPGYAQQLSIYMTALGMPGLFVVKNRNTGQVLETKFAIPPWPVKEIEQRILAIEDAAREEELPPCDDRESWYCKFSYLHESKQKAIEYTEPDAPFEPDDEFKEMLKEYHRQRNLEDAARWERDDLRRMLLEKMGEYRQVEVDGFTVERRTVVQSRMDNAKVKKMLTKEQREKVMVDTPTEYFMVNVRKNVDRKPDA